VDHAAFSVKAVFDDLKKLSVLVFNMPEDGIGNQVCELNKSRSFRVQEDRNIRIIAGFSILMT
jgi:hypothetical protein